MLCIFQYEGNFFSVFIRIRKTTNALSNFQYKGNFVSVFISIRKTTNAFILSIGGR